ncbi:MAG: DNA internalization-related competence protein ComEC/Rec2 [Lachnospiraceae bacterium]|nr:DNA internalization-related competence protein ComEC/Rec2 [Lachnospiraceae bacterium]
MRRPLYCICAVFVATVFLYLKLNPLPEALYDQAEGSEVTLLGEVYQKEYSREQLVLHLKHIKVYHSKTEQSEISGVICYIEQEENQTEPKIGSTIAVKGTVSYFDEARNPGEFDVRSYYRILGMDFKLYKAQILAESKEYSGYRETLYRIRCFLEGVFDKALSEKDAAVMKAMVLGNKSELDKESRQLYQKSGISHIFAISGLHITLLGMGLYKLLKKIRLPQVLCAVTAVCIMTAYGSMVGMSSSAYRAVFMFGMQLTAKLFKRTYDMLTAMAAAAALILIEQPLYINHTGFLLSFGAILGLGCMAEAVEPAKHDLQNTVIGRIKSSLSASLGIFLIHFPIMLCVYYEFPIYSFLLNLVIIPAMSIVMLAGLLCLGFGSLSAAMGFGASGGLLAVTSLGAAKLAGAVCHLLLLLFEQLCRLSLKLPFANWIVGRPDNWRIGVFGFAVVFLYVMHHYGRCLSKEAESERKGINIGLPFFVRLITVLAAVVCISSPSADGVRVTFLDVGQGDCIWIESAKGEHFLIDGGSTSQSNVGTYTIVPYLKYMGVSHLDAVFLTHLDNDHISGVAEMLEGSPGDADGVEIGRICISDAVPRDQAYEELAELCRKREVPIYRLRTGDRIDAYGLCFEVLHPQGAYEASSRNASSLVMKLTIQGGENRSITALFTGDVEADGEHAAACELAKTSDSAGIDIYKAAHHGSKYSNTLELIEQASPKLAVISCGADNSYGHPHMEAVENFERVGSEILITKDTGAIMIKVKGGECEAETYK